MTDPLKLAEEIERKSYVEGLWFEVDIDGTDTKLVAAALRLAESVGKNVHTGALTCDYNALDTYRAEREGR